MIEYLLYPVDPSAHTIRVQIRIPAPDPEGQRLAIAAWTPGSYRIRDHARHVLDIRAQGDSGEIALRKLDKHTWQCAPGAGALSVTIDFYAREDSVRGAYLDTRRALIDGAAVLPRVVGAEREPCSLELRPPDDRAELWEAATSMTPEVVTAEGWGRYSAADWWELIDHPVGMGQPQQIRFDVDGVPHALVAYGAGPVDDKRVRDDLVTLCRQHVGQMGCAPHDRYLFLLRCGATSDGGLEHRLSTTLATTRDALPAPDCAPAPEYLQFLRLCSHEYFHLWNVKRLRPAALDAHPLDSERHTEDLWAYEGVTSYIDDYTLLQARLVEAPTYLNWIAEALTRLERTPGRMRQSLADASFDAWTRLYQPAEHRPASTVSYYLKGALVALALDLELRRSADMTLLDMLRGLWTRHDEATTALPEHALEAHCVEVGGPHLADFFKRFVHGTDEPDWAALLAEFGVRAWRRPPTGSADSGGVTQQPPQKRDLGLRLAPGGLTVAFVEPDSAARRCGLMPGDELLALDGERLTRARYERFLLGAPAQQSHTLHWFSDERLHTGTIIPQVPQCSAWALSLDPDTDDIRTLRRKFWLGA